MTQRSRLTYVLIFIALFFGFTILSAQDIFHHKLAIKLQPAAKNIEVTDTISLPEKSQKKGTALHMLLHAGLAPKVTTSGASLKKLNAQPRAAQFGINTGALAINPALTVEHFPLTVPPGTRPIAVNYGGVIFHAVQQTSRPFALP